MSCEPGLGFHSHFVKFQSGLVGTMVAASSGRVMPRKLELMLRRLIWLKAPKVPMLKIIWQIIGHVLHSL